MTTEDRPSMMKPETADVDPQGEAIRATSWEHFDSGASVITADGEELGTVRERMPHYLEVKAGRNLLTDVEMYVPRELVDRVEEGKVYLNRTSTEVKEMDLKTPPALQ